MTESTDISKYRPRASPMAPTLRDSGALFWLDPRPDVALDTLRKLPEEEMAAILIKGLFAIYHLAREHAKVPRRVPDYLYTYARAFDEPIIPTAETLYEQYFFERPIRCGDDIPEDLLELGLGTARNVNVCVHHAQRMHRLLLAFADHVPEAFRVAHWLFHVTKERRKAQILLLFEACAQWSIERRRLKSV